MLAGHYELKVTAPGFASFTARAEVQVDATTRVDAALAVGSTQSAITVTDEIPLLKTDRADVSTTFTGAEVEKLPILDRNLTSLVLSVPGAQLNSWQHAASENPQGGFQINVNGQAFTSNGFLLDGTENESAILGIAVINPNLDSLQDFKVTTSNYDAEFGSVSGALLQATTKSGTNQLHGSLFEYLRNDVINAANPFTQPQPADSLEPIRRLDRRTDQEGQAFCILRLPGDPARRWRLFGHHRAHGGGTQRRSPRPAWQLHLRRWHDLGHALRDSGYGDDNGESSSSGAGWHGI